MKAIKLITILSVLGALSAQVYPTRAANMPTRPAADLPQIERYSTYGQSLEVNRVGIILNDAPSGHENNFIGDIISVNNDFGVEMKVNNLYSKNFPGFMIFPDDFFGFRLIAPYAYTTNTIVHGDNLTIDYNFEGVGFRITFSGPPSRVNNTLFKQLVDRFRIESTYARNVRQYILTKVDTTIANINSDKATINAYGSTYNDDKARIPQLNSEIAKATTDIVNKEAELKSNRQQLDISNKDLGTSRQNLNKATQDSVNCEKETTTLKDNIARLTEYEKTFTESKEDTYFYNAFSKQCKLLVEAEDLGLILPTQKLKVKGVIRDLVKLNNFSTFKPYLESENLYINSMN